MYYDTPIESEAQALALIRKQLGRIACPRCSRKRYIRCQQGRYYCTQCRYAFSLKVLLGFKHSKLSYYQLLMVIAAFSKRRTIELAQEMAHISYPTAQYAYSRMRRVLPKTQGKLAGDIVVDECFVGKRKTGNQCLVAGAVNRAFTEVRLHSIPDREQHTLEQFVLDTVETTSHLTTDAHASYFEIRWYGYGHAIENHSLGHLKKSVPIERVWSLFKEMIRRVYHHIWKEKIDEYRVEFEARFNHREIVSNPLSLLTHILNPVSSAC